MEAGSVGLVGWVGGCATNILQPFCGPICKIARFQAELRFPSWTECGNIYKSFFGSFSKDLLLHTVDFTSLHVRYTLAWTGQTSPNISEPENGKG